MTQSPAQDEPAVGRGVGSLTDYFEAAMRRANYEMLEDGEGFFGSIPELQGVWGHGTTLEECRRELRSALEDWVLVGLYRRHPIPPVDGLDLNVQEPE
jgi:predicted RNase H-like HicB family nuclease